MRSAANCQGISHCVESGHPAINNVLSRMSNPVIPTYTILVEVWKLTVIKFVIRLFVII